MSNDERDVVNPSISLAADNCSKDRPHGFIDLPVHPLNTPLRLRVIDGTGDMLVLKLVVDVLNGLRQEFSGIVGNFWRNS